MSIPNPLETNHVNKFEIEKMFASMYQLLESERKKMNLSSSFATVEINPSFLEKEETILSKCNKCKRYLHQDCFYKIHGDKLRARCKECIKKVNLEGYHKKRKIDKIEN
jgi:NAD-dependent SIR2 family protein deacetylase